jgi:hypothetical protein
MILSIDPDLKFLYNEGFQAHRMLIRATFQIAP